MTRRLSALAGIVLALGFGVRPMLARPSDDPASPPSPTPAEAAAVASPDDGTALFEGIEPPPSPARPVAEPQASPTTPARNSGFRAAIGTLKGLAPTPDGSNAANTLANPPANDPPNPLPPAAEPSDPGAISGPATRRESRPLRDEQVQRVGQTPDDLEAPLDEQVERVQQPSAPVSPSDGNPLGPAKEPPGGAVNVPDDAPSGDPFIPPPDTLKTGPNAVGLSVEIRAPEVANLNLESTVWIIVKNTGPGDAMGIRVRYPLPENLELIDSQPTFVRQDGGVYYWQLNTLASGAEKVIKVKVKPRATGDVNHTVAVTLMAGSRARTVVRQPKLKVEVAADKTKPLKGQSVRFDITVTNLGDYPARDVVVQAKLGQGLNHVAGRDLLLPFKEELGRESIGPGESVPLKLEVDTLAAGMQTCDVSVVSPDLPQAVEAHAPVEVVEPRLNLELAGPPERYPDNLATYRLTVTNPGTAPAKRVLLAAQVPTGGTLISAAPRAKWASDTRTLYWSLPELPPGRKELFEIQVRMGGVGTFSVRAAAKADTVATINQSTTTHIKGITRVQVSVSEPRGVLDMGEETTYEIRVRNDGTKEATHVAVKGTLSEHLQVLGVSGAGSEVAAPAAGQDPHQAILPLIDRLPAGGEVTLSIRVKAVKEGIGSCLVTVLHDDIPPPGLSSTTITRVTPALGVVR